MKSTSFRECTCKSIIYCLVCCLLCNYALKCDEGLWGCERNVCLPPTAFRLQDAGRRCPSSRPPALVSSWPAFTWTVLQKTPSSNSLWVNQATESADQKTVAWSALRLWEKAKNHLLWGARGIKHPGCHCRTLVMKKFAPLCNVFLFLSFFFNEHGLSWKINTWFLYG